MKSRFLIFTLFLAVMCLGSASNAMAQSATGTGVFNVGDGGAPATITVSAQQGGSGGIMRLSAPGEHQEGTLRGELTGRPVDICVQDNLALVVAEITHGTVDFAGTEGQFMLLGFRDNGGSGDAVVFTFPFLFSPVQVPACDLIPIQEGPVERGGFHIKP